MRNEDITMFVWKKEFELGIKSIDEQHQELLNIGNKVYDLINEDSLGTNELRERFLDLIGELKDYTKYHFRTEEDLFLKYQYTGTMDHIKEHREFIDYIDNIIVDDSFNREELDQLLKKLVNWVFNHIITTDFLYKEFLIKKGLS